MKKLYKNLFCGLLFLFMGVPSLQAQVPDFSWAKQALGQQTDSDAYGRAIATDAAGNTYVAGYFEGRISFGPISLAASLDGGSNAYLVKYNASGLPLWVRRLGGGARDIAVDASGNVYITGSFWGAATFGNITLTSGETTDIYIVKYDASGTALWGKSAGGTGENESGTGIAVDGSGNAYITGEFSETATFGTFSISSAETSTDIFVAKYDAAGTAVWARRAGGAMYDEGTAIAVDGAGNAYVTGYYDGAATFGTFTITGDDDMFIAKYDGNGNVLWVGKGSAPDEVYGSGIAVDGSGNAYITGSFEGTSATFGTTTLTGINHSMFLVKYNSNGNVLWARKAGGTGSNSGNDVTVDGSGNAYIVGLYIGTAIFGTTTLTTASNEDVFMYVAKYDGNGNALWAQKAGGGEDIDGSGIAVDGLGNAYVTGSFESTATFGSITLTSGGDQDMFLAKYNAAGTVQWVRNAGGANFNTGRSIAVDGAGNSYVTGYFQGTITFGATRLTSEGDYDVFVAKYDASGNLLWARRAGGSETDYSFGIAVDGSGNAYITGEYYGTATFGTTSLNSGNSYSMFVVKYNSNGSVVWARNTSGTNSVYGNSIGVDGSDNVYIGGGFFGTATVGTTTLTSRGSWDLMVVKYNSSGNVLWARSAGGTGDDRTRGIAVDATGNSAIIGYFSGTATFGTTELTSAGAEDIFIAKYDAMGNALWARNGGSPNADAGYGIAMDGAGNAYVTGVFQTTATFGAASLTASGSFDVFLVKYNSAGTVVWAQKLGGTSRDEGFGLTVDASGNAYVTGIFQGEAIFGTTTLTSAGSYDMFIAKYNTSGTSQWAKRAGGTDIDEGRGIAVDGVGNVYLTGFIQQPVAFGATTLARNGNGRDIFVTRIGNATSVGIPESELAAKLSLYPNPTRGELQVVLPLSGRSEVEAKLFTINGQLVKTVTFPAVSGNFSRSLDLTGQAAGIYLLQIITNGEVITRRVVKE